jgi:hypothetical protein
MPDFVDKLKTIFNKSSVADEDASRKLTGYLDLERSGDSHAPAKTEQSTSTTALRSQRVTNATLVKALAPSNDIITFSEDESKGTVYVRDETAASYTSKGKDATTIKQGKAPASVFNRYSLMSYKGTPLAPNRAGHIVGDTGGEYHRINPSDLINPTASKIIEITSAAKFSPSEGKDASLSNYGYRYDYSDFALARYYGKIPNNMLLTLRRFPSPTGDDIITPKGFDKAGNVVDISQPDIARAITYMGEAPGNNISEIIKFKHGYTWKEATADVQTITKKEGSAGIFGGIVNGSTILSAVTNAAAGNDAIASNSKEQNKGYDSFKDTYPNHLYGPLNVIKSVLQRESGLNFDQEFKLTFEYELKSIGGANPKVMMLDQLANILVLTYNNAPFWGGSVRYIGNGEVARPLGDLSLLKEGKYGSFLGSIVGDMGKMFGGVAQAAKDLFAGKDSKLLNNLIGGSLMKMFNTPQGGQAVNALLTGDATGQWHLTIGNPLNPIAVIGNLACTDTDIQFSGGFGVQDFPERMTVIITLKPARPRDKAEIESMFNAGQGRFYIQPTETADVNKSLDVSAYGNKDRPSAYHNEFRKISNG